MTQTTLYGNLAGLKPSQLQALERIYRRRVPPDQLISPELARYLTERSLELRRQLGVIIDRAGTIHHVIVGDDREIVIPDLSTFPLGRSGLRGLRCVHTHLKGEPLSKDDLIFGVQGRDRDGHLSPVVVPVPRR